MIRAALTGIAFLLSSARAPAEPLRLSQVLDEVQARAPEQAVAGAQVAVARADVHTARMLPNPGVLFTGDRTEPIFTASLQVRLPIFGQRAAQVTAALRAADQAQAEATLARFHLRHEARLAYYAVARAEAEVEIAGQVEALTGQVALMAKQRYDEGAGTRLDDLQASLVHARALADVSDRRAAARVARFELARLYGKAADAPLGDPLEVAGETPPAGELLTGTWAQHPKLRVTWAEREAAQARADAARKNRRPVPTVELGLELLSPGTCGGGSYCVGPRGALSFELPVLNLNGGPIERAEAEVKLAEARALAVRLRIEAAVRAAEENFRAASVRARFFESQYLPGAVAVEAMAREGFAVGKTGLFPLIEAERALLEARLGRAEALYAVQSARADLEEASGVSLSAP